MHFVLGCLGGHRGAGEVRDAGFWGGFGVSGVGFFGFVSGVGS